MPDLYDRFYISGRNDIEEENGQPFITPSVFIHLIVALAEGRYAGELPEETPVQRFVRRFDLQGEQVVQATAIYTNLVTKSRAEKFDWVLTAIVMLQARAWGATYSKADMIAHLENG